MAMSYWPKEGQPLWGQYSTAAVAHTIRVYSRFMFDDPYPVIISVNGYSCSPFSTTIYASKQIEKS